MVSPLARVLIFLPLLVSAGCSSGPHFTDPTTPVADADLRLQLLTWQWEAEQARQRAIDHGLRAMTLKETFALQEIDRRNADRLRKVVKEKGWPGIDQVGRDGAEAAFLIAMATEHDPALQKGFAQAVAKAWAQRQVAPLHYATLVDLVRLRERGQQLYGTQTTLTEEGFGPLPIERPDQVDARRAAIGLESLAEQLDRQRAAHRLQR